jgi:AraC family ethanolamine operon transcriptional activator
MQYQKSAKLFLKISKMQSNFFLIKHQFQDIDDFAQTARAWNLNINQLERGSFKGDLLQFGTGNVMVAHAEFYPGTYQRGEPPQGLRTFGILADPLSHLTWRHKMIPANAVMAFPPGTELDAVSQGGRFEVFTLSFSDELLADISQSVGFLDVEKLLNGNDVIAVKPQAMTELLRNLHRISRELREVPTKLEIASLTYELEFDLTRNLLTALSCSRDKMPQPTMRMRDVALKRVEDYLEEFPHTPHTVRDICQVASVSARTLEYAFRERFGIPPKSFLLALRLNGVRRELKDVDTISTTITDLATRWGFWHMSQFAADYRRFFGELPSATFGKTKLISRMG